MSHAAQCVICQHAKRRGRLPVGCQRFADPDETQVVLNQILYRLAGTGRCGSMEKFNAPPDAYMAQDDPDAQTVGDIVQAAAKQLKRER